MATIVSNSVLFGLPFLFHLMIILTSVLSSHLPSLPKDQMLQHQRTVWTDNLKNYLWISVLLPVLSSWSCSTISSSRWADEQMLGMCSSAMGGAALCLGLCWCQGQIVWLAVRSWVSVFGLLAVIGCKVCQAVGPKWHYWVVGPDLPSSCLACYLLITTWISDAVATIAIRELKKEAQPRN